VIPEIDIWRVSNLMLKRYGDEADTESALRAEELAEQGDHNGAAVWRRVTDAIGQLASKLDTSGTGALTAPRREGAAKASPHPRGEDYSTHVSCCLSSATAAWIAAGIVGIRAIFAAWLRPKVPPIFASKDFLRRFDRLTGPISCDLQRRAGHFY